MNTQSYGWRSIRLRLFLLFALVIAAVLFYAVSEVMTQWNTRGAMRRSNSVPASRKVSERAQSNTSLTT